ncbi:hypothetical protein [Palleronia sp.]|uniref:hypothetical protein n=1 Tax=Palleronia sp. TaxID=1940284 RepID=UPI0035C86C5E
MLFSECFEIDVRGDEPWFDPLLILDTKLYIDPFLIFQNEFGPFDGAHQEIVDFYDTAFRLVARAGEAKEQPYWNKAISILGTPEVEELCLGVTAAGTRGAGAGSGKARLIAEAIRKAVLHGLAQPKHFETLQLFQEGIAEDTISDAVGNILRHRFASYTQKICEDYEIETVTVPHHRGRFNSDRNRWEKIDVQAPVNPHNGKQILLVPKEYLRPMPTLNPDSYWGFCYQQKAEEMRMELGEEIGRHVNKDVILELALEQYGTVEDFVAAIERIGGAPYDIEKDPKGLIQWYYASRDFAAKNPVALSFADEKEFHSFIDNLISIFKNYVENQGGWELLFNDDGRPKSESACQRLFLGIVRQYCIANNIDLSAEVNIGRGPVDFKTSRGSKFCALIELKLANNSKFWSGLKKQLPKYLAAEEVKAGRFLIIAFNESDVMRLNSIYDRISVIAQETGYEITHEVVDAVFRPPSASNL